MKNYAPKYLDLASRDLIVRAMATEIFEGRGCGEHKDHLYLEISHLGAKIINEKLPAVADIAKIFAGIDIYKDPIPVVPTAHYIMGGIPVNLDCQVVYNENGKDQIIPGLLAIGEAACVSVHGANRLGCNSLLDIIVFGERAGEVAAQLSNSNPNPLNPQIIENKIRRLKEILGKNGDLKIAALKEDLQKIVWQFAGVFRNDVLLKAGIDRLLELEKRFDMVGIKSKNLAWNNDFIEYLEVENLFLQSIATIYSALQRTESRGAHFREDFQKRDDENWLCHSLFAFKDQNNFDFKTKSVRNNSVSFDIVPQERKY